jgi:hypothetical protein
MIDKNWKNQKDCQAIKKHYEIWRLSRRKKTILSFKLANGVKAD